MTVLIRHAEPGEDCHHHKQVIDGEHLFQRVAGEEQARHLGAVVNIQESGEGHRHHDPENGPHRRAFQRDGFIVTVHKEVDKHRPYGHHHKDNNGFRRETEMSSRHTKPFWQTKHNTMQTGVNQEQKRAGR